MALDAITSAVPQEKLASLSVKATAAEAWEAVRSLWIGSEAVRNARAKLLRTEFESIHFKEGETIDDFTMRLGSLVAELGTLREVIKEQHVVQKLLRVIPKHLSQVAVAIEVTQDLLKLTLEDAGGRLQAVEDRAMEDDTLPPPRVDVKLLLMEEQQKEKMCQRGNARQGSSGGSEQRRRPRKHGNGGKKGVQRDDKYDNCGRTGHWARDCRQPRKGWVNLTQAEDDDEPTLLMAMVEESHDAVEPAPPQVIEPALEQQQIVHLDETKAQAFLDTSCSDDNHLEGWYLDTGAMNHMTGRGNVFSELDRAVQGTIKFGDGSVVNICGKGTIIFSGRHGEHKVLTGMYWIPHLKNSIISIRQMDEGGACVLIEGGVLRVWDWRHRLLTRVQRTENRIYRLELQVVRPLCLAVHQDDDAWRWHERLGHVNFGSLEKMGRLEMVRGLPPISHAEQFCDTCVLAKHRRGVFLKQSKYRANKALELVHGDLCGPVKPTTPDVRRYFLLLVDDATRYMWVVFLTAKSEALSAIKHIQVAAEKECDRKIRVLRTDNGGEFTTVEFTAYCANEGFTRHFSAPYTPQQNEVVVR
jgi:transposase InsO family protein